MLTLALIIAFLVLEILAAVGVPSGRVNLQAAGLACFAGSLLASRLGN